MIDKIRKKLVDALDAYDADNAERKLRAKPKYGSRARGFGTMPPSRRREVAASGGAKSQANGTGYRWTKEQAKAASQKAIAGRAAAKARRLAEGKDE
jgi:hypothetical protein